MARKTSALAGIFDDEMVEEAAPVIASETASASQRASVSAEPSAAAPRAGRRPVAPAASARTRSHGTKKPVLIHIPEDMHRALRQLSVEEGGEPLTVITERMLRQYLVSKGHTKFAPASTPAP